MFRHELDCERAALNEEKLTLAAEVLVRPVTHTSKEADPISQEAGDSWLGPRIQEVELGEPHRSRWWLAAVLVLASGISAAAYSITAPDAAAWFAKVAGALR